MMIIGKSFMKVYYLDWMTVTDCLFCSIDYLGFQSYGTALVCLSPITILQHHAPFILSLK